MINVEVKRQVDLSAEIVWEEMRHFDRVLRWIPGGDKSTITVNGNGVGAVRDIHLATQGYVQHRLTAYDEVKRMFSYELTGGKPIGMQSYWVTASVTVIDSDHCSICWSGQMSADASLNEEDVADALEIALGNMVIGTIALLKNETPKFHQQPNEDWQLRR